MAFNEWLERNPWKALFGISVTIAGASVGTATYFFDQHISLVEERNNSRIAALSEKHEHEVDVLKRYLNAIKRGINESDQFDIRTLFVADDMPIEGVRKQESFAKQSFYAVNDPEVWTYEVTDELAIAKSILTPAVYTQMETVFRTLGIDEAARAIPMHAWKYKKVYRIEDNSLIKSTFGRIGVQMTTTEKFEELVLGAAKAFNRKADALSVVMQMT
jgi:hypothetical protein